MKKKLVSMILTAAMVTGTLVAAGCGSDAQDTVGADTNAAGSDAANAQAAENADATETADAGEDQLAQIKEKGEIVVAMEGTWSPWTYHDENDELVGYDVEVAKAIAEKLGVEATFVEGEWDGLFAGMDAGRYDIVVNGVDITEERAQKYDFTEPYAYNRTAIIVTKDNDEINSFEDLDGKNTANTISSTYAELAEQYGAFELLLSGRIDATLNAELTYYDYLKAHPDANVKIAALTEDASEVAIPLRKGAASDNLRAAINQALDELRADGTLSELSVKYFGSDVSSTPDAE